MVKVKITYLLKQEVIADVPEADWISLKGYYGNDKAGLATALHDYREDNEADIQHYKTQSVEKIKE